MYDGACKRSHALCSLLTRHVLCSRVMCRPVMSSGSSGVVSCRVEPVRSRLRDRPAHTSDPTPSRIAGVAGQFRHRRVSPLRPTRPGSIVIGAASEAPSSPQPGQLAGRTAARRCDVSAQSAGAPQPARTIAALTHAVIGISGSSNPAAPGYLPSGPRVTPAIGRVHGIVKSASSSPGRRSLSTY